MKYKLICISVDQLIQKGTTRIIARHNKKLTTLINLIHSADGNKENPNETIVNLTGQTLTQDQIDVLKLGLQYGLTTTPNEFEIMSVAEDVCTVAHYGHPPSIENSTRSVKCSIFCVQMQCCSVEVQQCSAEKLYFP